MENEGSCNESANWDLKKAREAYETLVSEKEKWKIAELEAAVIEEEEKLDIQAMEKEID